MKTGLADKGGDLISFPEFATTIKGGHNVHPIIRIAAWVQTIWIRVGIARKPITDTLGCLSRLQLIDQAKFPCITGESGIIDFSKADVFSKAGNYNDIMWLADTINHG